MGKTGDEGHEDDRKAVRPRPGILIAPEWDDLIAEAVRHSGARVVSDPADAEAIIWLHPHPHGLAPLLRPDIRWVQLPSAGVAEWLDSGVVDDQRVFTSAAGAYAHQVAEHALTLMLAGRRRLATYARAHRWQPTDTRVLSGSTVAIVGCGGIGRALIGLLQPLDVEVIAVNRSGDEVPRAARTLPAERTSEIWSQSDVVVLSAPATAATYHLVGKRQLAAMPEHAWVVNVARGTLVDTAALVEALDADAIAGAALDVTDPEPLPDSHPLWRHPRALVTPHVANPPHAQRRSLAQRVRDNVQRFARGDPLIRSVDPEQGY